MDWTLSSIETALKISAIIAAACFFGWKLFTGWLIINLRVAISTDRAPADSPLPTGEEADYLAVTINLEKRSTDTLWLRDISFRVTTQWPHSVAPAADGAGTQIQRLGEVFELAVINERVDWNTTNVEGKRLTLSPEEALQFARVFLIPRSQPAFVEAAVHGNRTFWTGFQWRASAVSLPRTKPS